MDCNYCVDIIQSKIMSIQRHLVSIKDISPDGESGYFIAIEGYDAIQQRDFSEIIKRDSEGYLRGECLDPRKRSLSASCLSLIRTKVNVAINNLHK
jgi:hypothetical protein